MEEFRLNEIRQDLQRRVKRVDDHMTELERDAYSDEPISAESFGRVCLPDHGGDGDG